MVTQLQARPQQVLSRNATLDHFRDFAGAVRELERLCAGLLQTNQRLHSLLQKKSLEELNSSMNLQYLLLQQEMQEEQRRFAILSSILKTKHDTAKNSISNLR